MMSSTSSNIKDQHSRQSVNTATTNNKSCTSTLANLPDILGGAMSSSMREVWNVLKTVDEEVHKATNKRRKEVQALATEVRALQARREAGP